MGNQVEGTLTPPEQFSYTRENASSGTESNYEM